MTALLIYLPSSNVTNDDQQLTTIDSDCDVRECIFIISIISFRWPLCGDVIEVNEAIVCIRSIFMINFIIR